MPLFFGIIYPVYCNQALKEIDMAIVQTGKPRLRKELRLFDVFAIATGTTLSAGFFLLPGIAATHAGPAIVLSYMIAVIPLVPAMFSIIELATAMPRAGGVYYFLDRTLGPAFGSVGGLGTWLALVLKVSFALVGMGAYIKLFLPDFKIIPVAVSIAFALGIINYLGAKKTGRLQVFLVIGLLAILAVFIFAGLGEVQQVNFSGFADSGFSSIFSTAGLVYISYVGITNIASLSEEVKEPEKNLPRGVIISLSTAFVIYTLGTIVMVGVLPMDSLAGNLTPVAEAAGRFLGKPGMLLLSLGALIAFISVANAGTMSASRYPLAMSRDHLLPRFFTRMGKMGTPYISITITVLTISLILIFVDPTHIAKLASAFQLLMFALVCLGVIVMRESRIRSYDPGYKSPFYPWMQLIGIASPIWFIVEMGLLPSLFSAGIIIVGTLWYFYYARKKVYRTGAVYHVFRRLGKMQDQGLDTELRGILKEKGLRSGDPFDDIIAQSYVLDLQEASTFEEILDQVANWYANIIPMEQDEIRKQFLEGTRMGATPVTHGIALPHLQYKGIDRTEMVMVRAREGLSITFNNPLKDYREDVETVRGVFFLISPENNPTQHLRILAQIAGRVDEPDFCEEWLNAKNEQKLKEVMLRDDRFLSLKIKPDKKTSSLMNKSLREINFPKGCLVAMLRRSGETMVPQGNTMLEEGDRITIIGDPKSLDELRKIYLDS